jgi:hypothetical protein
MRNPWRMGRDGFNAVFWDLFGDDLDTVGHVYVENKVGGMSSLEPRRLVRVRI